MTEIREGTEREANLRRFNQALESGALSNVPLMLNGLYPAEIAHLLESLPSDSRKIAWEMVSPEFEGDVLLHLSDGVRAGLISEMAPHELLADENHIALWNVI